MSATLPLLQSCDWSAAMTWWRGARISRRDFLEHVRLVSEYLWEPRYTINLCEDRYLFLVAFAAVVMSGGTNLLPPSRARQDTRAVAGAYPNHQILTDADVEAAIDESRPTQVAAGELNATSPNVPRIPADQVAVIAFTSGSTGQSRAHAKRWGDAVEGARCAEARFGFRSKGVTLVATVPAQHMYGLETSVLVPLACGVSVHGSRPFYAEDIRAALAAVPAPRVLITTPIHLRVCVESRLEWPAVEFIISATAPLTAALAREAERILGGPVLEIYGCTEAGSIASRRRLEGDLWHTYDGMSLVEIDDGFYVRARHLPAPVALNDLLVLHDATHFELAGRLADLVNIAGKRASLGDLNLKLNEIRGVRDAVFVAPDVAGGCARLLALVVAPELTEREILRALAEHIDCAFMPRPLYKVERLPRNPMGKLVRAELLDLVRRLRGYA